MPKNKLHNRSDQQLSVLAVILLGLVGCSSPSDLPADSVMSEQWQRDKARLLKRIEMCAAQETSVTLKDRYLETDRLITPNSLDAFGDCDASVVTAEDTYVLEYLGKTTAAPDGSGSGESYLMVTHQHREGTGWIEEAASRWTGGWISWKSSILEEKGFIYVPEGNLTPLQTMLPASSLSEEPLDQFTGEYRATSQISGNSSCEIWRIRPIEPKWALFYHQTRECPS